MMTTKFWTALIVAVAVSTLSPLAPAQAAPGTVTGTFVYKDPITGVEQALAFGYVYLHNAVKDPPMEKFFSKADYILGPTASGTFSVSAEEGSYYIRILARGTVGVDRPYGPPEEGDFTWMQQIPIVITAGATLNLGKKYAALYSAAPVTISGTVKNASGVPLQDRYVRAQTEPCLAPVSCTGSGCQQYGNRCGSEKFPALQRTGADGGYTIMLADPGTYYIYTSTCLLPGHNGQDNDLTRCEYFPAAAPVTVSRGDRANVNLIAN